MPSRVERKSLREWRASRRLTMQALATLASVSKSTIESIENDRHPPSLKTMRQIAGVFGVGLDQIIWESDAKMLALIA